ncbi:alpha-mannosyltransferase, partial [Gorgonomyces haynaldii]
MANGTLKELYHSYSGKGIVVPVYNKGFYHAYLAIRGIREVHQSSLPIYCTYNGEDDLAPRFREKLLRVQNVTLIDLEKILPPEKIDFDGWSNKPAMLLAAPCEECVLMDSDVWWLQSPERAFEQSKYLETGMLLYKDRTVPVEEWDEIGSDWVKGLVPPEGLPKIADLRIMQHKSMHEVESGVVIVNKRKRFLGLLFVTYLNAKEITPESYDTFLGDKETFWIGMTTMLEDYHLDPHKVVTLGFYEPEQSPNELCSQQMAHLDEDGDLFWIHGGVVEDKFDFNSKMQKFTHWIE